MFKRKYLEIITSLIALLSFTAPTLAADQLADQTTAAPTTQLAYQPTSSASVTYSFAPSAVHLRHTRPTIALALGGGGIRGAAHIGVLKVFERENLPIDFIAGSSMGAIVGGMYAAGVSVETLDQMFRDRSLFRAYTPVSDTLKLMTVPTSMLVRSTKLAMGLKTNLIGLHPSNKIASFVDHHVSPYRRNIEQSEIPFVAVATNLLDGKAYALEHGNLGRALEASSAIPFYLKPVSIDGKLLVDGALRCNVPSVQARQSRADIVISVNVDEALQEINQTTLQRVTPFGNRVLSIVLAEIDSHQSESSDVEICPSLSPMPLYSRSVKDAERAMRAGELAAENALPQIRMLLNSKLAAGHSGECTLVQY